MWYGTHTKAYILNSYESVMCLTVFAFPGLYIGFPVLRVLCYDFPFYDYHAISVHTYSSLSVSWVLPTWYMHYCAHPASPLGFASLLARGVSLTPLDSHVQALELGAYDRSSAAVAWISSRPSRATSFQDPSMPLGFPLANSWVLFYTFHTCTFLVYLHVSFLLYRSYIVYLLYSRICAY